MDGKKKFVNFDEYCSTCEHYNEDDIESVCNECLNEPAREDSHKPEYYEEKTTKKISAKPKAKFIKDYLYYYNVKDLDYSFAMQYFKSKGDFTECPTGCSVVRNGNFIGRNLDWYYDNNAEFIVKVPRTNKHYASIGICGGMSELTNSFVKGGEPSPAYDILPFMMYDGLNEYGVFAEVNVVPNDYGNNIAIAKYEPHYELSSLMIIRFILDNFRSAKFATEYIQKHCNVYFPRALHEMNYEVHFMVADKNETYILEFINNKTRICLVDASPYITNFHIGGVTTNRDGTVMTPETGDAMAVNNITKYGSGLERYNLIAENYDSCNTAAGMREMCNKLLYSQTYLSAPKVSDPFWYTEYVGGRNIVSSPVEQLRATAERIAPDYTNRVRGDNKTWQTNHSVVYDLENLSANIIVQEDGQELNFSL